MSERPRRSLLLRALNDEPNRLYDEIRLMNLNVVVAPGGKDMRSVGFEFDQPLGRFRPEPFQIRE